MLGLNIHIDDFHLDEPDGDYGCQSSWLQIFEGENGEFPVSDRLCGSDGFQKLIQTNSSKATIWFHSDENDEKGDEVEGFNLYWDTRCDNHIKHSIKGSIQDTPVTK